MSQRSVTTKISALLTLGLTLATTAALAQDSSGLELRAYIGEPGWSHIADGSYTEAAKEIQSMLRSADLMEQIAAYNNLCVATTMLREFEAAESACDSAVNRAKRYERQYGNRDRSASSTALSNRGVLNILLGNPDGALADLERASAFNRSDSMAPEGNLAYTVGMFEQSFADAD
jgi:tetratricopeptide (TPR) repeat protein